MGGSPGWIRRVTGGRGFSEIADASIVGIQVIIFDVREGETVKSRAVPFTPVGLKTHSLENSWTLEMLNIQLCLPNCVLGLIFFLPL